MASWWRGWRQSKLTGRKRQTRRIPQPRVCPYAVQQGRLVYLSEQTSIVSGTTIEPLPIADFSAAISEEITAEDGVRTFAIAGETVLKEHFTLEISATDFADDRMLKAALTRAARARAPVRAGMARHLAPAIQMMTTDELRQVRRYERTGWADGRFLIAGRETPDVVICLPRKLPYSLELSADEVLGIQALGALLEAITPSVTTVMVTPAFQAPLARLAGWLSERYGTIS